MNTAINLLVPKRRGILHSLRALSASQERVCSMELVRSDPLLSYNGGWGADQHFRGSEKIA
jgi:hypothetical protein